MVASKLDAAAQVVVSQLADMTILTLAHYFDHGEKFNSREFKPP